MASILNPLNVTKKRTRYSELPIHEQSRDVDEKQPLSEYSDDDLDSSDGYSTTPESSRETSTSYAARPMLRTSIRKPFAYTQRRIGYRVPNKIVRYLCCALISTLVLFILVLVRQSIKSAEKLEKPPAPPPAWEKFDFLTRYYGGIRTLVPASQNKPEYPTSDDEPTINNTLVKDSTAPIGGIPASKPFLAFQQHTSEQYLATYAPVQECFLDEKNTVRIPQLQYYEGRPTGFPENVLGSYELLGLPEDICFERYGRLGPYGFGYGQRNGGMGLGQQGEKEGSEAVWNSGASQVVYKDIDWAAAQKRCYQANAARFEPKTPVIAAPTTFSVLDDKVQKRDDQGLPAAPKAVDGSKKLLSRTAVVIRVWDDLQYQEERILNLRSLIAELSLASGGEYDVHLLVQVRDEALFPIWADADEYQKRLNACVPKEFHGIATLWTQTQMLMMYQGIHDLFTRGPDLPVHGVYRGLQMAMQYFAQLHPEYDHYWEWEIDIRYTGHYYNLFEEVVSWAKKQPRKGLWERNSRFYVPSVHGTWEDFKQMVRVQTEMGTESPNNMWSGLNGAKNPAERPKGDKSIWGPERPRNQDDWFETDNDPVPPTSYEKDKYAWGVGEEADIILFNPLFDPEGTTWLLADDITGYNVTEGNPPRRAAIVTASRMSKRLLNTMHREAAFKKHFAFSEMWAPTTALHHGYKAVYVPHPMFVDREWPTEYMAGVFNGGRNGASGGARTSVFGDREHNLRGVTWFYNTGFAPNLWKRWLGMRVDNEGGEDFEKMVNEGRSGVGGPNDMKGGEGRMCLPPMLLHPVKEVDIQVDEAPKDEVPHSDPSA